MKDALYILIRAWITWVFAFVKTVQTVHLRSLSIKHYILIYSILEDPAMWIRASPESLTLGGSVMVGRVRWGCSWAVSSQGRWDLLDALAETQASGGSRFQRTPPWPTTSFITYFYLLATPMRRYCFLFGNEDAKFLTYRVMTRASLVVDSINVNSPAC